MAKEKIRMLHGLLLCRPIPPKEKTSGGIIIPSDVRDEAPLFEVVEFGPEIHGLKKGDIVAAAGKAPGGQDVIWNGEKLIVIREKYVAVLDKKPGKK